MKKEETKNSARKLVLCDFDGTITQQDVGYSFLNTFAGRNWEGIDGEYVEGKIGSKEAYTRIAKLINGTKEEMINFIHQNSSLDPHFKEFLTFCGDRGVDVKIVSDGFSLYIKALLQCHTIEGMEYFANKIVFTGADTIEVAFPFWNPDCGSCGVCKRQVLKRFRDEYDDIIFVGNGISDRCIAEEADDVYAKDNLYSYCIEKGIPCWNYDDFSDVKKNLGKNIKGVIFDLDGTLIDSLGSIFESFNFALEFFGYKAMSRDELNVLSKRSVENALSQIVDSDRVNDSMELFKKKYIELVMNAPPLFSDANQVVSFLKESGIFLGIATNLDGKYAQEVIGQSEINGYFKTIIGPDDANWSKPHPAIIYLVLKDMNVSKEEVVFVGDSIIDIDTGKNAGVDVYAVATGFETQKRLSEKRPKRILNRLEDLIGIIKNLGSFSRE